MSIIFVRIIHAIIVTVADVNPRNAISIVAREKISEASSSLGFAILWRFVGSVTAIVVSVAVPSRRNATVVRTPEAVLWTSSLSAV